MSNDKLAQAAQKLLNAVEADDGFAMHAAGEEVREALASKPVPAREPMTEERIYELARQNSSIRFAHSGSRFCCDFARAIERHHGITKE